MARPTHANAIAGACIAIVAILAIAALIWMGPGTDGTDTGDGDADAQLQAIVHDGDGDEHVLPLSQDTELAVETSLGTNIVVVSDGVVFVREADCENQDCVHQGKIDAPGKQLICLPHRLWIEVVAAGGQGGSMDVDAVAGSGGDLDAIAR